MKYLYENIKTNNIYYFVFFIFLYFLIYLIIFSLISLHFEFINYYKYRC